MERTGLWDIKGSEGYIYAAFKFDQRRRYLGRQEVKQNLDSDVPCCLPALEELSGADHIFVSFKLSFLSTLECGYVS